MAISIRTVWEVRVGGATTNSGGYNPANVSAGTDYSRQLAAQFSYTDLVIGAANSVTSAAFPFTSAVIGNLLHINAGTNFTPGWYEVTNVVGVTATLDRSPGTLAATGGTAKLGGALSTPNDTPAIAGGIVYLQAGAGYTTGVAWVLNDGVGDGNFVAYIGYGTTRGDNLPATVTSLGALSPMLTQANQIIVKNLVIDGANLANRGITMGFDSYAENVHVKRCALSGMLAQNEGTRVRRCLFSFNGAGAATGTGLDVGTGCIATECEAHDNKQGFSSSNGTGEFVRCLSHDNTASGFYQQGDDGMHLRNCTADGNAVDGLQLADASAIMTLEVANCLFTNNTTAGIKSDTTNYSVAQYAQTAAFFQNNAFYNNGGSYSGVPAGAADVILTADPYTDRAGGDYSLNGTDGGGAALRGAGVPGGIGLLGTSAQGSISYVDIGAIQGLAGSGSGGGIGDPATLRSLWRELTNEFSTTVIPDSVVDLYLNGGLQALNRRVHYHLTDTTSAVTLVAGTQEYDLPTDTVMVAWVQWNGREIPKSDTDEWRRRDVDWRNAKAGAPQEWAHYRNRIIFYPSPDANAVATAATPLIRYVSTPPDFATSGAEQLALQDRRIIVYWGVAEWANAHPDSALATIRAEAFQQRFEEEAEAIKADYLARMVGR